MSRKKNVLLCNRNAYAPNHPVGNLWYASLNGNGDGSIGNPWGLQQALSSNHIIEPSDILYVRGGTYTADYGSSLRGEKRNRIIIQPYPNETVVFQGSMYVQDPWTEWKRFWLTCTNWPNTRVSTEPGSTPSDLPVISHFNIYGDGTKLYRCKFYDCTQSINFKANQVEIYGCISWNNGWIGPDRGHGHGVYSDNPAWGGLCRIENNIFCNEYGWGIHAYSSDPTDHEDYLRILRNICFSAGVVSGNANPNILVGGETETLYPYLQENVTYQANIGADGYIDIGYLAGSAPTTMPTVVDNYFPETVQYSNIVAFLNKYGNFEGPMPITGKRAFVFPDKYTDGIANVAIYNFDADDTVSIDLSGIIGISAGDVVFAINVQDYINDIQILQVSPSLTITINMQAANRTIAAPAYDTAVPTTFPIFGAFVVGKPNAI